MIRFLVVFIVPIALCVLALCHSPEMIYSKYTVEYFSGLTPLSYPLAVVCLALHIWLDRGFSTGQWGRE